MSTPAAIYAGYVLDSTINQRGVLPPEALDRDVRLKYLKDLKRAGLRIAVAQHPLALKSRHDDKASRARGVYGTSKW